MSYRVSNQRHSKAFTSAVNIMWNKNDYLSTIIIIIIIIIKRREEFDFHATSLHL